MDNDRPEKSTTLLKRVHGEIVDDLDEEMELEIDDERVAEMMDDVADHPEHRDAGSKILLQGAAAAAARTDQAAGLGRG